MNFIYFLHDVLRNSWNLSNFSIRPYFDFKKPFSLDETQNEFRNKKSPPLLLLHQITYVTKRRKRKSQFKYSTELHSSNTNKKI